MATQMRVWDASMVEQDEEGLFIETEDTTYPGTVSSRGSRLARRVRIVVPDRFLDMVSEARTMSKRLRVYYKLDRSAAEADLVEIV